jgi:REP-associated tyrosine transposase
MNQPERNSLQPSIQSSTQQSSTQKVDQPHEAVNPQPSNTATERVTETLVDKISIVDTIHYLQFNSHGQRPLFAQRSDYRELLALFEQLHLEHQKSDTTLTTLAFCLLPNSIHWVIKTPEAFAKPIGQQLQQAYTSIYNQQQQRNGSLFHPHMVCQLVEPQRYLSELVRQIHYLPVTEKLVAAPSIYPWSSHSYYLNSQQVSLDWFETEPLFNRVARQRAHPLRRYSQYMAQPPATMALIQPGVDLQDPIASLDNTHPHQTTLASETYKTQIESMQQPTSPSGELTLQALIGEVCGAYGVSRKDLQLWRRHRLTHEVKSAISALALDMNLASLDDLATELNTDKELLENGIRFLQGQKPMFLHGLALSLAKQFEQTASKLIDSHHNEDINAVYSSAVATNETEQYLSQSAQS